MACRCKEGVRSWVGGRREYSSNVEGSQVVVKIGNCVAEILETDQVEYPW